MSFAVLSIKRLVSSRGSSSQRKGANDEVLSATAKMSIEDDMPAMMMEQIDGQEPTMDENVPPVAEDVNVAAKLQAESQAIQAGLAGCSALLGELADNLAPWSVKDNATKVHATKAQLDKTRACVMGLLAKAVKDAQITKDCQDKLAEREVLLVRSAEQEQALLRSFQQYTAQQAMVRSMLQLVDEEKLASKESRLAAGGRVANNTTADDMLEMLALSVQDMVEENQELWQTNGQLEKTKVDLTKRFKETSDKMKNDLELRDREIQTLKAALKKAGEEVESGVGAAKTQSSTQLAKKTSDIKALQRRTEVAKTEADQAKAQSKAYKASLDKAQADLAKGQEEAKALTKKMQGAVMAKDSVARDLENAKAELGMVFEELRAVQAVGKISPEFCNKDAAWPRVAYTARGGRVMHSSACGNVDTSKCVTFQYVDQKELETCIKRDGLVLCHACRSEPGF